VLAALEDTEFRITIAGSDELTVVAKIARGHLQEFAVERKNVCLLNPKDIVEVAFDRILEVAIRREALDIAGKTHLRLGVALWHCGLPVDVLPASGFLEVSFGEEHAAWDVVEKAGEVLGN
jgi:hypothetical protein